MKKKPIKKQKEIEKRSKIGRNDWTVEEYMHLGRS
tara:strand:+ start:209 stop:313 length:105 start_codon:yes stop_codon:yes gene_type:complete